MTSSKRLVLLLLLSACTPRNSLPPVEPVVSREARPAVVLPDGAAIDVELAADDSTRQQGLMFRESLAAAKGMLFLFSQTAVYPFWMKNTLIPLDIIWIDESKRVVYIARDVPPCRADPCTSYSPATAARYVLELAAGQAALHQLNTGDQVVFKDVNESVAR